jgi:hypothetical protein
MRLRPRLRRRKRNVACKKSMLSAEFKSSVANDHLPPHLRPLLHPIRDATDPMERTLEDIESGGDWLVKTIRIAILDLREKMRS